jgi:hypothetical protein
MSYLNYLPYAVRDKTTIPANDIAHVRLNAMAVGGGIIRNFLQDICVYQEAAEVNDLLLMRYGYEGQGFLTEDLYPPGIFHNKAKPLTSTWRFIKPYRMNPGEFLRAQYLPWVADGSEIYPSIFFNGVRTKDRLPSHLYDTFNLLSDRTQQRALNGITLWCDRDSAIQLYGVSITEYTVSPGPGAALAIYGPDSREWFHYQTNIQTAPARRLLEHWGPDPFFSLIALDEPRGWVMERDETLIVEYENTSGADMVVWTTLRGSMEVLQHGK